MYTALQHNTGAVTPVYTKHRMALLPAQAGSYLHALLQYEYQLV